MTVYERESEREREREREGKALQDGPAGAAKLIRCGINRGAGCRDRAAWIWPQNNMQIDSCTGPHPGCFLRGVCMCEGGRGGINYVKRQPPKTTTEPGRGLYGRIRPVCAASVTAVHMHDNIWLHMHPLFYIFSAQGSMAGITPWTVRHSHTYTRHSLSLTPKGNFRVTNRPQYMFSDCGKREHAHTRR